eukprot:TRINITY_DN22281_c0_g1_i4.p1 TRINITY_DN22281_c0_g1~~TRINITY_DN22281_c0_g1_i4.p1  ORF type:complete len:1417 (-),score=299.39 TRINITY_DN22281_c0_g1_i4:55-4305(-)
MPLSSLDGAAEEKWRSPAATVQDGCWEDDGESHDDNARWQRRSSSQRRSSESRMYRPQPLLQAGSFATAAADLHTGTSSSSCASLPATKSRSPQQPGRLRASAHPEVLAAEKAAVAARLSIKRHSGIEPMVRDAGAAAALPQAEEEERLQKYQLACAVLAGVQSQASPGFGHNEDYSTGCAPVELDDSVAAAEEEFIQEQLRLLEAELRREAQMAIGMAEMMDAGIVAEERRSVAEDFALSRGIFADTIRQGHEGCGKRKLPAVPVRKVSMPQPTGAVLPPPPTFGSVSEMSEGGRAGRASTNHVLEPKDRPEETADVIAKEGKFGCGRQPARLPPVEEKAIFPQRKMQEGAGRGGESGCQEELKGKARTPGAATKIDRSAGGDVEKKSLAGKVAATRIQSAWRGHIARRTYLSERGQRRARLKRQQERELAQKRLKDLAATRQLKAAVRIQSIWRGSLARREADSVRWRHHLRTASPPCRQKGPKSFLLDGASQQMPLKLACKEQPREESPRRSKRQSRLESLFQSSVQRFEAAAKAVTPPERRRSAADAAALVSRQSTWRLEDDRLRAYGDMLEAEIVGLEKAREAGMLRFMTLEKQRQSALELVSLGQPLQVEPLPGCAVGLQCRKSSLVPARRKEAVMTIQRAYRRRLAAKFLKMRVPEQRSVAKAVDKTEPAVKRRSRAETLALEMMALRRESKDVSRTTNTEDKESVSKGYYSPELASRSRRDSADVCRRRDAALRMQRVCRGYQARKVVKEMRRALDEQRARQRKQKERAHERELTLRRLEAVEQMRRSAAAVRLQAAVRGCMARKYAAMLTAARLDAERCQRELQELARRRQRQAEAALQRQVREAAAAAAAIDAKAVAEAAALRRDYAAIVIQSAARGHAARQCSRRARQQCEEAQRRHARELQRRCQQEARERERELVLRKLQAMETRRQDAATRIQASWRRHHAQRAYRALLQALWEPAMPIAKPAPEVALSSSSVASGFQRRSSSQRCRLRSPRAMYSSRYRSQTSAQKVQIVLNLAGATDADEDTMDAPRAASCRSSAELARQVASAVSAACHSRERSARTRRTSRRRSPRQVHVHVAAQGTSGQLAHRATRRQTSSPEPRRVSTDSIDVAGDAARGADPPMHQTGGRLKDADEPNPDLPAAVDDDVALASEEKEQQATQTTETEDVLLTDALDGAAVDEAIRDYMVEATTSGDSRFQKLAEDVILPSPAPEQVSSEHSYAPSSELDELDAQDAEAPLPPARASCLRRISSQSLQQFAQHASAALSAKRKCASISTDRLAEITARVRQEVRDQADRLARKKSKVQSLEKLARLGRSGGMRCDGCDSRLAVSLRPFLHALAGVASAVILGYRPGAADGENRRENVLDEISDALTDVVQIDPLIGELVSMMQGAREDLATAKCRQ